MLIQRSRKDLFVRSAMYLVVPFLCLRANAEAVNLQLVAQIAQEALDQVPELPVGDAQFSTDSTIYLELWSNTSQPNGLAIVSADVLFDPSLVQATAITHSDPFSLFPNGTIDNQAGLIDDLSGSHPPVSPPCSDAVGSMEWARVATIEMTPLNAGPASFALTESGSEVYVVAICGSGAAPSVGYEGVDVSVVECDDQLDCTDDSFNGTDCVHEQVAGTCLIAETCYSDGDPHPLDDCLVCTSTLNATDWSNAPDDSICDDGDDCTDGDICTDGLCAGTPIPDCTECGLPEDCDDLNECTTDDCIDGQCVFTQVDAGTACTSDGDACTSNECDALGTCVAIDISDSCDNGLFCDGDETCDPELGCLPGTPPDCDDLNECTDDSCDDVLGCVSVDNAQLCDDGDACTTDDSCAGGTCAGVPLDCDDDVDCTVDECEAGTGICTHLPGDDACGAGLVCHEQLGCIDAEPVIRITEYMYSGADGEFFELTNLGETAADLTGWSFDDDSNTPGSFDLSPLGIVEAGESVIVTESIESAFRTAWGINPGVKVLGGSTQGLGRNDAINIWDASNTLVDHLQYGDEVFPGSIRTQNASGWVCDDGIGSDDPYLWLLSAVGDERASYGSAGGDVGNPGSFVMISCPQEFTGACCALGICTDDLTAVDCELGGGTYQGDDTLCVDVTCPEPSAGEIRITEYMYSGTDGEFFELTNLGETAIDLTGWSFDDDSDLPGSFDLSSLASVEPGESVIVTESAEAVFRAAWALDPSVKILGGADQGLGRNDSINIFDAANALVDVLHYGDEAFPGSIRTQNASGWVCDEGIGTDNPYFWILSAVADEQGSFVSLGGDVGNPGSFGIAPCPDVPVIIATSPAMQTAVDQLDSVSVTFSTEVVGVVAADLTVDGSAATSVSGSGAGPYEFTGFAPPSAGSVDVVLASGAIVSQPGGTPFAGFAWTVSVGEVIVINELHYHPDESLYPAQEVEFLELYNAGSNTVDMSGWEISSGVGFTFPPATMLAPDGYLVVAVDPLSLQVATGYAGAFQWTSGMLSNGGERVAIVDAASNLIDEVTYSDGGEWAFEPDGDGPSLELINPAYPNELGPAWQVSSVVNGTPGAENSAFSAALAPIIIGTMHEPPIPAANESITVTANVIDNDPDVIVTLYYRQDFDPTIEYSSLQMHDDGAHSDGVAGDGVYGVVVPGLPDGERLDFTIRADDGQNVSAAPAGHDTLLAGENPAQTYLCKFSDTEPFTDMVTYHLITTQYTRSLQTAHNEVEYDATFIQCDLQNNCTVFYNVLERYRGQSSLNQHPHSFRVNFSSADPLPSEMGFPITKLNLMAQSRDKQFLGYDFFASAFGGVIPTPNKQFVRFNTNPLSHEGIQDYPYINVERIDDDFLESQDGIVTPLRLPDLCSVSATVCISDADCPIDEVCVDTDDGNLYRGRLTGELDYRGENPDAYSAHGYDKETNAGEDDWTDLIDISRALDPVQTPDEVFEETVEALVDELEWARWFAIHMLLVNQEGGIYRDTGDDYYLYFQLADKPNGYDAEFYPWDLDSVFGGFNAQFHQETIWRTTVPGPQRFLRSNAFAGRFVESICSMLENEFAIENIFPKIDALPEVITSPGRKNLFKAWIEERHEFVNNEIVSAVTIEDLPSSPYIEPDPLLQLSGDVNQCGTHSVLINGQPVDSFSVFEANWSHEFELTPGFNDIHVQCLDHEGAEVDSVETSLLYAPDSPDIRLTVPARWVNSKTLTLKAELLDPIGNVDWQQWKVDGQVSVERVLDESPIASSITVFDFKPERIPEPGSIRFYNGIGTVSLILDNGAAQPPDTVWITVTLGEKTARLPVTIVDENEPGLFRELSGTLTGDDLVWSPDDGVIRITGDAAVPAGEVLEIQPGTLIMVDTTGELNDGTLITVDGRVNAVGTRFEPIHFFSTEAEAAMKLIQETNSNPDSWRGIRHNGSDSSNYGFVFLTGAGNGEASVHPRPPILHFVDTADMVTTDCVFTDNPGKVLEGAGNGSYTVSRCVISRAGFGGEFLGNTHTLLIEDSWWTASGWADDPLDGDHVHIDGNQSDQTITRCVFTDAGDDGIDHSNSNFRLENTLIWGMKDKAVSMEGGSIDAENVLMFDCSTGIRGGGKIKFTTIATPNPMLTPNNADQSIVWPSSFNTCNGDVNYTIVGNPDHLGCGIGNLSDDPLFADPLNCDYTPAPGSPALTAGPTLGRIGWLGFPVPEPCALDVDCDDGLDCTFDTCDVATASCVHDGVTPQSEKDLLTFASFQVCYTGAGGVGTDDCICSFNSDGDEDIDADDFAIFLLSLTGPPLE